MNITDPDPEDAHGKSGRVLQGKDTDQAKEINRYETQQTS
jgi:hypothetical protein